MFPFQLNLNGDPGSKIFTLAIIVMTLLNFCMALFWLLVGWRAMKAHERLPDALSLSLRATSSESSPSAGEPAGPGES